MAEQQPTQQVSSDDGFQFFSGVRDDLKRRLNWTSYASDWRDGLKLQIINASAFMFLSSIAPALSFAATLKEETNGQMGLIELVFSTCVCGIIFAVISGQPLNIVGVTGPTIILYGAMHGIAEQNQFPFLPFMGWACVWASLILLAFAFGGVAALAQIVTRFTDEIFGGLIAMVYISIAVTGFSKQFTHVQNPAHPEALPNALLSFILAMGTATVCLSLHHARTWKGFTPTIRDLLARYNTIIALLMFTGFSFWGILREAHVERLTDVVEAPGMWDGKPSLHRAWVVDFLGPGMNVQLVLLALVPGILLVLLLFFDHSVVSLISAAPQFKLKKGPSFHWDTVVLAFTVLVCGILGLPPVNGVLPQSPMHVQACAIRRRKSQDGSDEPETTDEYVGVIENRLSPLCQSALCGVVLAILPVIREIPISVLWGLFLYFGVSSFYGNQMMERATSFVLSSEAFCKLPCEGASGHAPHVSDAPRMVTFCFTLLQFTCLAIVYYVGEHAPMPEIKISFAVLIVLLIPLRRYILPLLFSEEHLEILDGHGDHDDSNQSAIRDSLAFPSRGSIRSTFTSQPTYSRATMPVLSTARAGSGVSVNLIRPPPFAAHSEANCGATFQHQQDKMLLRMRRRDGQPAVGGFRFRHGKLNASHPLRAQAE